MQINEAKKKLIDITTDTDMSKYTSITLAKKRLLETDLIRKTKDTLAAKITDFALKTSK